MIVTMIGIGILQIVLCLIAGPFFEGISRKYVKARIAHGRVGPLTGAMQPFWDLAKLLGKEDLEVGGVLQRISPILCMGSALTAATLIPLGGAPPLGFAGDFIVLLYLLTMVSVTIVMGAMASGTSYTMGGALREVMGLLLIDLVMAVSFITVMVNTRSMRIADWIEWEASFGPNISMILAMLPVLMILPAQFGKIPFDTPEAEQELLGGPLAEMSGRKLALYKWAIMAKQFVVAALFVQVFFPWPLSPIVAINIVAALAKVLVVFILMGVVEALMPRLRIDQALKYYATLFVIGAMAIVMACLTA
jgi:formate hydrogenlyase subunit 4